ncbi:RING finger protein [Quillaja saponaria]|uniref:RING finger protein n=1 Tax=Quillaja saponaria TaxID=32244 RepID=A0AAD7KQJ2_QUISA|nr:RING finger protein [Quillaja saponaria]
MGSSGSKATTSGGASSSFSDSFRKGRSKGHRGFRSYCLGTTSGSHDNDNEDQGCDHQNDPCTYRSHAGSDQMESVCFGKVKSDKSDEMGHHDAGLDAWGQASITNTASRAGSSSAHDSSNQSLNPSSRFLSRFSFIPGNVSFRLSRTTSLGSSRSCPVPSEHLTILNNEDELHLHTRPSGSLVNGDETLQCSDLCSSSLVNDAPTQCFGDTPGNTRFNGPTSGSSDVIRDRSHHEEALHMNLYSPRIHPETESTDTRYFDRRIGAREPVERNVRFSRTLSVGRLRDRVLRRSTLSDLTFRPPQQEREARDASQDSERRARDGDRRTLPSDGDAVNSPTTSGYPQSSLSNSLFSMQDYEVETSRSREARYQDLLENRSNFLERRRRIRSQVRALQRLGSRFENLSGHDRSCILSGQHRTGRCTCRISSRDNNVNEDTGSRTSISRIVMLAEALFEVLDEIHQQSVVLSSRPSVSSIGSVPARHEVVDSLPIKLYSKLQTHHEEAAQCYICLVEYEDGDSMRVLPCNHEFHRTCIDKWLKEIHRVCPLCRGDICTSGSHPAEI